VAARTKATANTQLEMSGRWQAEVIRSAAECGIRVNGIPKKGGGSTRDRIKMVDCA
jgi:hypothetical protein